MADAPLCPETGEVMRRGVRPMTISYKGLSATFDMPGWYADGSEESVHTGADLRVQGRELAKLRARIEGLHGPDDVRRVRERLGVSQRDAGTLIGGGPNAFQKYESGEVMVSRAISNLLLVLERRPEDLDLLRRNEQRVLEPA